jgi:HD-GYP domain-containing protein (c-di-GMP phosphodiesterase class II)
LKKGIREVYLIASDFARYVDTPCAAKVNATTQPIEQLKQKKLYTQVSKSIFQGPFAHFMNPELYRKASGAFEVYTQPAFINKEIFNLVDDMNNGGNELLLHATYLSFLSGAVAIYWKWSHPKILGKIFLSALLCKVGLKNSSHLLRKDRDTLQGEDRRIYDEYPTTSHTLLAKIDRMPEEILLVAQQHQENESGTGFPFYLTKDRLHNYARLVHGVSAFIGSLDDAYSKEEIKANLDALYTTQNKQMSAQVLKTLYHIFEIEPPKELASTLLPFETARMI